MNIDLDPYVDYVAGFGVANAVLAIAEMMATIGCAFRESRYSVPVTDGRPHRGEFGQHSMGWSIAQAAERGITRYPRSWVWFVWDTLGQPFATKV